MTDKMMDKMVSKARRSKCRNCVQFDGERLCTKYRMVAEPFGWCKSFKLKNIRKALDEEK